MVTLTDSFPPNSKANRALSQPAQQMPALGLLVQYTEMVAKIAAGRQGHLASRWASGSGVFHTLLNGRSENVYVN
jgi:hypothetical protein